MNIHTAALEGILVIEPAVYTDNRGYFMETYHRERYTMEGILPDAVQDNLAYSIKGTLRGLHFQIKHPQAKLVQVIFGEIFDAAVDLRPDSDTFGRWFGIHLSDKNKRQLYIPEGFAHGYCVLSEAAYVFYKCSDFYHPEDEGGIIWSDEQVGIDWPIDGPLVSPKDLKLPPLSALAPDQLPQREERR
jgi:dTDP-4-dehydrorhamnose 3,5-epimerase